ncbi:MAG: RlmE family RNA methyltransferase [Phycisphaeraceae bacterium]|nr:RlmE family RNA methyltransferase [Phycisphaerales bacterium]MCB9859292.1 RlmE family RNA methyltransferase [Phycisphaeraceae bacterium]
MAKRVLHDEYFKKAKEEGYLARSAYKLIQINERFRLIKSGYRVLDLGCAPGAWLQVASKLVGNTGRVVGLDLKDVREKFQKNVRVFQGDVRTFDVNTLIEAAGGKFDVVVSDMAPNTSGAGDDLVSCMLCQEILNRIAELVQPGSSLAMKVFEGSEYKPLLNRTSRVFKQVKGFKPKASRDISREIYIVGEHYKGPIEGAIRKVGDAMQTDASVEAETE